MAKFKFSSNIFRRKRSYCSFNVFLTPVTIVVVLSIIAAPVISQNDEACEDKFQRNSDLFLPQNRQDAIDKSLEDITCGMILPWSSPDIDWKNYTSCVDNNTLIFHFFPDRFKDQGNAWDGNDAGILSLICLYFLPLDFDFYGVKPQSSINIIKDYTDERFIIIVSVPYESDKTGNYTFYSVDEPQKLKWTYVFFERQFRPFLLQDEKIEKASLVKSKDYDSNRSGSFILPCRSTNYFISESPIELYKIISENEFKRIEPGTQAIYKPDLGFMMNFTEVDSPWGEYICTTDFPNNFDSIIITAKVSDYEISTNSSERDIGRVDFDSGLPRCEDASKSFPFEYISNVFTRNPTQSRMVKRLLFKGYTAKLTKYDSDPGPQISANKLTNGYRTYCDQSGQNFPCGLINIYKSGLVMCYSSEGYVIEEYFTGMDNAIHLSKNWKNTSIDALAALTLEEFGEKGDDFFYANDIYFFQCSAVSFFFLPAYRWKFLLKNGTIVDAPADPWRKGRDKDQYGNYRQSQGLVLTSDVIEVLCGFFPWNSSTLLHIGTKVVVREKSPPKITSLNTNVTFVPESETEMILCSAIGIPLPTLSWKKDGQEITTGILNFKENLTSFLQLNLSQMMESNVSGAYSCYAENSEGNATIEFNVEIDSTRQHLSTSVIIVSGVLVCSLVLSIGFIILWHKQRQQTCLTTEELDKFRNGSQDEDRNAYELLPNGSFYAMPYRTEFEIAKENFEIYKSSILGAGEFGLVLKGKVRGTDAAVKTVKPYSDKGALLALLSELKILIYIERHENIVEFIGAYTSELERGKVFVFVEYCPMGSLERFLRTNKSRFCIKKPIIQTKFGRTDDGLGTYKNLSLSNGYKNIIPAQDLDTQDMIRWACQIAKGMSYLSTKNVIHGDLATRNILLKNQNQIKITDFGLSRQLHNYSIYKKTSEQPLPWRWLSLESLREMEFSIKSDVWSFGITIWEIFSVGAVPYGGLEWTVDFVQKLENGLRLAQPCFASDDIFHDLLKCWEPKPQNRPNFGQLQQFFDTKLEEFQPTVYTQVSLKDRVEYS